VKRTVEAVMTSQDVLRYRAQLGKAAGTRAGEVMAAPVVTVPSAPPSSTPSG
jgi:hypothetical protein